MRKLLLAIFLCFLSISGYCQTIPSKIVNRISSTKGVYTSSQLVKYGEGQILRVEYYTTSNNGGYAIYDALNPGSSSNVISEGVQAVATSTGFNDYSSNPLRFTNGLYLTITGTTSVIITYQ